MGAAGVMERGGVAAAAAGLMNVAVLVASKADVGAVSLLQAEAGKVWDGIGGEVVFTEAVGAHVAEGKKGLASAFRDELPTAAGRGGAVVPNGDALEKAEVEAGSAAFLMMESACAVGMRVSVGLDLFKAAPAATREEVLVTGVVV